MIVHSYARFSDPSQAAGDSLRRQREAAEDFCRRKGWTLSELTFNDLGRSGYRGDKQKALKSFLKAIDTGLVKSGETLLVEAVDRLSRKGVRATQNLVNRVLEAGVNIAILAPVEKVYQADDGNDIGGAIELAAFAYQASVYSENLSMRVKAINRQARKEYDSGHRKRLHGVCPAWLEWNPERECFDIRKDAQKAIRYIFKRTIAGIGRKRLLAEMNEKFPPISRRKNTHSWNETMIANIITSKTVLGELTSTVTGETIADYYPSVIDKKTWQRANVEASKRRTERGPSEGKVNVFNGILFHAKDGCPMAIYSYQARRKDGVVKYRRYQSRDAADGVKGASRETIDAERFESLVFEFLPRLQLATGGKDEAEQLNEDRRYLQGEISVLQERITSRKQSAAVLAPVLDDLQQQLGEVEDKLKAIPTTDTKPTKAYRKELAAMRRGTVAERRKVRDALRAIVKRIEVLPVKTGPLRRDRVYCLVEIHFRSGDVVRGIELPDDRIVRITVKPGSETLSTQLASGWNFGPDEYREAADAAALL